MQKRHRDRAQYFSEQGSTTEKYVIPFIEKSFPINQSTRVLEIGCGEGGNLVPFIKRACQVTGVDLNENRINDAKKFLKERQLDSKVTLLNEDIYKVDIDKTGQFDLIIMRDVIEHIHDQKKFLHFIKKMLKAQGRIFFGFPPWRMPFGGHQQMCTSKFLSKLPFLHLLPRTLYRATLKVFGEKDGTINALLEIKDTGISINRFERIISSENYIFERKQLYFINPNYEVKFGLKPRKLNRIISSIPHFRDFFTTCCYCLVRKEK